jgi:ubiquinone/menaquinone biosynthesis C-methylase UbiE
MALIAALLRPFFSLLYHQFSWTYDLVAATVSLGRWKEWVRACIPFLEGRVLEIGFGPGHLQLALNEKGLVSCGLDESRQMARQAARLLKKRGVSIRLARGLAQNLPFEAAAFDSVAATFPSEYIFDIRTLHEIARVLRPGGKLVILPMAWITGTGWLERMAAWLFRITGEAPGGPRLIAAPVREQFMRAGFQVSSELVAARGSQVLVYLATRDMTL